MSEFIQKIIVKLCKGNPILSTILIAMIPIVELRGAIPFGSSEEIFKEKALSLYESALYGLIGSIIIAVFIILLLIPVFNYLKKKKFFTSFVESLENKFKKKSENIENSSKIKHQDLKKWLGVMVFVAIPFPGSGVWTGSAVAVFLKMGFWKSFSAVTVGALFTSLIMILVTYLLGSNALIVFDIFFIILLVIILLFILKAIIKPKN